VVGYVVGQIALASDVHPDRPSTAAPGRAIPMRTIRIDLAGLAPGSLFRYRSSPARVGDYFGIRLNND
jgi:hypothetical protein